MSELVPELIRRVLVVMQFDNCDGLFWREDNGVLSIDVQCSDFFAWGCSDCEPIETEADVFLLEKCRDDLQAATGDGYPSWIGELYAARRRNLAPAPMMLGAGRYAMDDRVQHLFPVAADGGTPQ